MATPSMNLKLAGFQHGDGVFHIKALAFACPRTQSLGSRVFDSTRIVPDSTAAPWAFAHQMAHHGFLLYSPGLLPTSTGVVLQTFIQDTLLDWMERGNAAPAKIILWTKGLQKVYLLRPPEQHPFPGAPHQPTELRGPSVSSTCTALYNYPPLVDLPESCQTCLLACRARFSLTNLTLWPLLGLRKRFPYRLLLLYFRHLHSLLVTRFWTTL